LYRAFENLWGSATPSEEVHDQFKANISKLA